jgi:uncharacterized membrane protein YjgN (DUF898 family)
MLWRYKIAHASFGEHPLTFDGTHSGLQGTNIITLLLMPFTLGISRSWYRAKLMNHQFGGTTFRNCRFASNYTGGAITKLYLVNLLLLVVTFGLAMPLVLHRNMKFLSDMLWINSTGAIDLHDVTQSTEQMSKTGEGLAQLFDADIGFG